MDRNSDGVVSGSADYVSLSARRAWIEIKIWYCGTSIGLVALRKESVDRNNGVHYDNYNLHCRSPQGERG